MKYIDNSSLGATETITIGAGATTTDGQVAPRVLVAIAQRLEAIQVITTLQMKGNGGSAGAANRGIGRVQACKVMSIDAAVAVAATTTQAPQTPAVVVVALPQRHMAM